jgi:hypothetical protein
MFATTLNITPRTRAFIERVDALNDVFSFRLSTKLCGYFDSEFERSALVACAHAVSCVSALSRRFFGCTYAPEEVLRLLLSGGLRRAGELRRFTESEASMESQLMSAIEAAGGWPQLAGPPIPLSLALVRHGISVNWPAR